MQTGAHTITRLRLLRNRDIQESKDPRLARFVENVLPVLSAVGGPVTASLAARRMPGLRAAALGGGIAGAGSLPRFIGDARRERELAPLLGGPQNQQQRKDLGVLRMARMAGMGSAVLGGLAAGMKPGRLASLANAAGWGLLAPSLGPVIHQSLMARKPNPYYPVIETRVLRGRRNPDQSGRVPLAGTTAPIRVTQPTTNNPKAA